MYSALKTGEEEWLLSRGVFGPAAPDQQLLITSATRNKQWVTGNGDIHLLTRPDDFWGLLLPQGLDLGYQRNYQGLSNHQTLLFFHVGTSNTSADWGWLWGSVIQSEGMEPKRCSPSCRSRGRACAGVLNGKSFALVRATGWSRLCGWGPDSELSRRHCGGICC